MFKCLEVCETAPASQPAEHEEQRIREGTIESAPMHVVLRRD